MDASNKRGTLVLYGEDITLRSGRHMIPLEERPVAFDKEKDKQLPRSWPRDPPPKLEQLAKRPGVTCTFRTRPAVLTISGITRADVEEIKDTLTNASPDLGAVHLEIYLRMHIFTTTCEDLNFFMWRFFEDGDEQGEQGRGEGGVGEESDSHNYSVCSASSATSDSSTTSRSPQSSPYCSPRTEAGDARSTVSAGDSSGIGYSGSSGGSGSSGSGSSGSSTGGVPSPERQETGPVVRSDTSTESASSGHATPTREKEGRKPAMPDTTNNTTTATPATPDTPARAKEKLSEHTSITSSNSNSKSKPHQEDAGGSSSSSVEGENGKDRQSSPGEVHVDGDEVRVEVVPVDVEQLNGLMKLRDNEENFRIVGRAIRRALVWLGFTERVLFVATGPGAPFSADAVPAHLRSAVLDAVRTASGGDTEGRGTAGEGGEQQRGARSAGVGGGSNAASASSRSEMSGDSSDDSSSSVHGDSETEDGKLSQNGEGAVEVCSGRPVFVLASTDEEALRCGRAKVDDALAAFRLNVPPHCAEVPGYEYLHQAKHDIEEHDDDLDIAKGCGLSIAHGPLSLPEPWPKEMEHLEILILSWGGRVTVEEWRGLMTHLPKLKLLVCSNFNTDEVQEAVLANPEERDLFLRTAAWYPSYPYDVQGSKLFADGDVVAVRQSKLLHMLGDAIYHAGRHSGHTPHFSEALSDGILAFGKVEEEDMVWGSPDDEWGSKRVITRRRCPECTWDRLFGFCSRCELYEYDLDTGTAPFLEELKANS